MRNHIRECNDGAVAMVAKTVTGILREVQWQRPVGTEQAEKPVGQTRRTTADTKFEFRYRGRRERHFGLLPKAHHIFARTSAFAQSGCRVKGGLDHA